MDYVRQITTEIVSVYIDVIAVYFLSLLASSIITTQPKREHST